MHPFLLSHSHAPRKYARHMSQKDITKTVIKNSGLSMTYMQNNPAPKPRLPEAKRDFVIFSHPRRTETPPSVSDFAVKLRR